MLIKPKLVFLAFCFDVYFVDSRSDKMFYDLARFSVKSLLYIRPGLYIDF